MLNPIKMILMMSKVIQTPCITILGLVLNLSFDRCCISRITCKPRL